MPIFHDFHTNSPRFYKNDPYFMVYVNLFQHQLNRQQGHLEQKFPLSIHRRPPIIAWQAEVYDTCLNYHRHIKAGTIFADILPFPPNFHYLCGQYEEDSMAVGRLRSGGMPTLGRREGRAPVAAD